MAEHFSLAEVFRMAEDIERNGVKFYTQAAAADQAGSGKEIFQKLAEQEKNHERLFAGWREKYCGQKELHIVDPDGEVQAYIQSIADTHVFNLKKDVDDILAPAKNTRDILNIAIGFEKDTIAFFTSLKHAVGAENWEKLELLIQEEIHHIRQLQTAILEL